MSKNTPPFLIGDTLTCIKDGKNVQETASVEKGKEYKVEGLIQCPKCKAWRVDIGFRAENPGFARCPNKHVIIEDTLVIYVGSDFFEVNQQSI